MMRNSAELPGVDANQILKAAGTFPCSGAESSNPALFLSSVLIHRDAARLQHDRISSVMDK